MQFPIFVPQSIQARLLKSTNQMSHPTQSFSAKTLQLACWSMICVIFLSSGCVSRRITVRTEPEGAFVTVDGTPVGYSPVSFAYTYYGDRELQIEKDGYKTVNVMQQVRSPWYLKPPFSFVTENFWPREIRDQRVFDFQLEPKTQVNESFLLQRANNLRANVRQGTVTAP